MANEPSHPPMPAKSSGTAQVLPRSVDQMLRWLDPKDYRLVETMICNMPFTKDLMSVLRFVDTILSAAAKAEHRTGSGRIRGEEMDRYRDRMDEAVRALLTVSVELAQRAGFTDKLIKHKRVLTRHGVSVKDVSNAAKSRSSNDNPKSQLAEKAAA